MKKEIIETMRDYFLLNAYGNYTEISDELYEQCADEIMKIFFYANCGNSTIEVFKKDRYKKNKGV